MEIRADPQRHLVTTETNDYPPGRYSLIAVKGRRSEVATGQVKRMQLLLSRPFFWPPPNGRISDMKENIADFLPQPHATKQVFFRHHIPIAAVAKFLGLSTAYTCSLLTGFSRVSAENDAKLREFALLVEGGAGEAK